MPAPRCRRAARTDPLALTFWGDWLPGPIEAFNAAAMGRVMARLRRCAADFPPDDFGEDIWLQQCRRENDDTQNPVASCVPLGARLLQWEGVSINRGFLDRPAEPTPHPLPKLCSPKHAPALSPLPSYALSLAIPSPRHPHPHPMPSATLSLDRYRSTQHPLPSPLTLQP